METHQEEKFEKLLRRRAVIDATLKRLQAKSRSDNRKKDTRRKILIGALVMQEMQNDPDNVGKWVQKLLDQRLKKVRDRSLFDLPSVSPE